MTFRTEILFLGLLLLSLVPGGCRAPSGAAPESGIPLPDISKEDGAVYGTSGVTQRMEIEKVFPGDPAPALVIHCKHANPFMEDWKTEIVCWPDLSGEETFGYNCTTVETLYAYDADSGAESTEANYWAVQMNDDDLEDLLIVYWYFKHGDRTVARREGASERELATIGKPLGFRLIRRKSTDRGAPIGIASDRTLRWEKITDQPDTFRPYLNQALSTCEDETWRARLTELISRLEPEKK